MKFATFVALIATAKAGLPTVAEPTAEERNARFAAMEKQLPALEDGKSWKCGNTVPHQKVVMNKDGTSAQLVVEDTENCFIQTDKVECSLIQGYIKDCQQAFYGMLRQSEDEDNWGHFQYDVERFSGAKEKAEGVAALNKLTTAFELGKQMSTHSDVHFEFSDANWKIYKDAIENFRQFVDKSRDFTAKKGLENRIDQYQLLAKICTIAKDWKNDEGYEDDEFLFF